MTDIGIRLAGRVAVVTGGAKGIGAGIVRRFIDEGASVAICDIDAEASAVMSAELGSATRAVALDVTDREAWERATAEVEAAFGPIDILINNAGLGAQTFIESMAWTEYERVSNINFKGTLLGMQVVLPSLRRSGRGCIVNISSLQGIEVDVGLAAYSASKFAVRGITKCAALELGREGIRVNSIHPGMIRTPATGGSALPDTYFGFIPLKRRDRADRGGYPEDVGNLALYLCSEDATFVTGAEFVIDGGKSIRFPGSPVCKGAFA